MKYKNKVTYILGAGASANELPVVKHYAKRLSEFERKLHSEKPVSMIHRRNLDTYRGYIRKLLDRMSAKDMTVDTLAKEAYIKNDIELLNTIKKALVFFFSASQFVERKIDKRYSNFITHMIDERRQWPENVKILNWNYDFQFQIAANEYAGENWEIDHTPTSFSGLLPYYPCSGANQRPLEYEHSLIHLNGIAGFYYQGTTQKIRRYGSKDNVCSYDDLFKQMLHEPEHQEHLFTFAFETKGRSHSIIEKRIKYAKDMIFKTNYLVLIGYSFQDENYEVDSKLFDVMKNDNGLKKIIVQDLEDTTARLRDAFNIPSTINIIWQKNCEQFELVPERKHLGIPDLKIYTGKNVSKNQW